MSVKVHNTLSRELEEVVPMEDHHLRIYTCGPTVYDYAHIGNFRAYVFEDLLCRTLRYAGFKVTQVMNLTDVDDKTIRGANEQGKPLREYTKTFIDSFFEDLDALGIQRADAYPAATDNIPEMIDLIQTLIDKEHAYTSEDGSVYFRISSCENYGKLARLDLEGMQAGARVDQDEYEKDVAADFALWKGWTEKDGDVAWDAPWGRGRPGWHIECSAMAMKFLGESFDIHCGGVDNMFPHHEDEIAQSECATGKTFVKYWMHNAHLIVNGKKMSKSLGNFYTLRQIMEKDFSGRELRYVLIGTHYRQTLDFSFTALNAARASLNRVDEFVSRLRDAASEAAPALPGWAEGLEDRFKAALFNDLNIAEARAALFELITAGNKAMDEAAPSGAEARAVLDMLDRIHSVLGILNEAEEGVDPELEALLTQRQTAREDKDWGEADRIRDELAAKGWTVKDTPNGPKLIKQ